MQQLHQHGRQYRYFSSLLKQPRHSNKYYAWCLYMHHRDVMTFARWKFYLYVYIIFNLA